MNAYSWLEGKSGELAWLTYASYHAWFTLLGRGIAVDPGLNLGDLARFVRTYKRRACATFFLGAAATVACLVFWPRKYESEAGLLVRVGRESVTLDPTATTGQTMNLIDSRENELNSVLSMLQSRTVVEGVVDAVGVERILGSSVKRAASEPGLVSPGRLGTGPVETSRSELQGTESFPANSSEYAPLANREAAIDRLGSALAVAPTRKSSVIHVKVRWSSPEMARELVSTVLDVYKDTHTRANRIQGSLVFFERQVAHLAGALEAAREELRATKNDGQINTIAARQATLQTELGTIESDLITARADLAASHSSIAELRRVLREQAPKLLTEETTGFGNDAADRMHEKLYELRIKEQELRATHTAAHPTIKAIREQVQEAQAIVDQQPKSRTQAKTAPNPNYQALELQLHNTLAHAEAHTGRVERLEVERRQVLERVTALNNREVEITRLEQRVEQLTESHRKYLDNQELARIDEAMQVQHISNVNVFQPPTFITKPVSPRRAITLALGVIASACAGLLVAVLSGLLTAPPSSMDQIESALDVPILMSIPLERQDARLG